MTDNPFIKAFFDIEAARAKNSNIFDESKKLTAAQKKHLDKNDNDKIDAEDFKMLRKEEAIDEAKLSPERQQRLNDLVDNVRETSHPEYMGDDTPDRHLKAISKEFGQGTADTVESGVRKMHFGKDNQSYGIDQLANRARKGSPRITAAGKMNKQDVGALKNRIKTDKQYRSEDFKASVMNLAKKLAEDFVDPDGEIVAQARREKQNKAVDIKPAVIKPNPSFASKMSDTMNAYSGDKKDTTRDSSSEMSSSLRPRANPRLASDTATTSTNVDTTPKKEISGDQLAQIGASELNTPKVRTALQDPNKPTAGLASGLKAAAEKAVAAREPAPEVDRDRQGETARPAEPTKPAETSSDYTIQKGDNLTKLAKQNNTTIDAIMKANPQIKDPNLIYAGSKLKMPSVSESVEFSAEELAHIKSVMEAMPVAPTDPGDSPNPTPKKKAEGSRSKGSLAD